MKMAMAKQYCDLERNTKDMAAFLTPFSPPNDSHHVDALCVSRSAAGDGDASARRRRRRRLRLLFALEREGKLREEGRKGAGISPRKIFVYIVVTRHDLRSAFPEQYMLCPASVTESCSKTRLNLLKKGNCQFQQ